MFTSSSRDHDRSLLQFRNPDPVSWVDPTAFGRGLAAGEYRRDWTWLAFVDERPVARGVWWGPVGAVHPVELHCLLVDASLPHPEVWGAALIRSAHRAFASAGAILAPDYVIEVDAALRDDPATQKALAWRALAATDAGLTLVGESALEDGSAGSEGSRADRVRLTFSAQAARAGRSTAPRPVAEPLALAREH
ncbi:hypothetical protein [Herbiconiux sp.]|uniref:hypothetical protein n=1 Tax=Herbiconiux sp. TaxID=1871186 RepID=UPI0025BA6C12|nr:hypothetical protein [Herbiconiux sp.]